MSSSPHPTRERKAFLEDAARRHAELARRAEVIRQTALADRTPPEIPGWPGLLLLGVVAVVAVGVVVRLAAPESEAEVATASAELAEPPAEAEPPPATEPATPAAAPPAERPSMTIVNLGVLTQSLRGGGTLRIELQVEIEEQDRARVEQGSAGARDAALAYIATLSASDLETTEQRTGLRDAIASRVARSVGLTTLPDALFTQFVIDGAVPGAGISATAKADVSGIAPVTTRSGLTYYVLAEGRGPAATPGQTATVHYTGWLEDGTVFDSSVARGKPIAFPVGVGRVIKGWDEAVVGMRVGERRQLHVPPELAYGQRGASSAVPPNATLVFDLELLKLE
jgi:flagellar basal body-associated protein FliL